MTALYLAHGLQTRNALFRMLKYVPNRVKIAWYDVHAMCITGFSAPGQAVSTYEAACRALLLAIGC